MQTRREVWADIARITAIFFIILAHTILLKDHQPKSLLVSNFYHIFGNSGAPLFFILSGYFLLSKNESANFFYKKRLARIFFPWIFWTLAMTLINLFYYQTNLGFFSEFKKSFFGFWFLPIIFIFYLLTPLFKNLLHNSSPKQIFFLIFIWYLSVSFFPYFLNNQAFPYFVDNSLLRQSIYFVGYFIFGYLFFKFNKRSLNSLWIFLSLIVLIIFTLTLSILNPAMDPTNYYSPTMIPIVFLIIILIYKFFVEIKINKKGAIFLSKISSLSLGIYFFHDIFILKFLKLGLFVDKSNYLSSFINGTAVFTISLLALLLISKIKFLKRFIT